MICNVLAPQAVVVGGELGDAGETFVGPLRQAIAENTQPMVAKGITVQQSTYGHRSEILGALQLASRYVELP